MMPNKLNVQTSKVLRAVLASAFFGIAALAEEVGVTASVDKKVVELHDTFQLQIAVQGTQRGNAPRLPKLKGFQVLSGPHTQTSVQIVNGRMSRTLTYVYTLRPNAVGTFTIPALTVRLGRKRYTTQPITIEVIKGSKGGQLTLDEAAFVELAASKTEAFVYEQIELSLKVYVFQNFQAKGLRGDVTAGKDFLEEDLGKSVAHKESQTTRDGRIYRVQEIPLKALFPVAAGKRTIPGTTIAGTLLVPRSRARTRRGRFDDFFDSPFDGFFGRGKSYDLRMRAEPLVINVKPLPDEGRPPDFSDVVGAYDFRATVVPKKTRVGDGITLTMVVSGQGYIKAVTEPKLQSEEGFKVYRSEVTQQQTAQGSGTIGGTKSFKKIIEPQSDKTKEVPAVIFSFFDPRVGRYTTIRRGPFPVEIAAADVEKPIQYRPIVIDQESKQKVNIQTEDILPIMTTYSSFPNQALRLYRHPAVIAFAAVPPLALLLSLLVQRKRERLITDRGYARRRRAYAAARKRLAEAKQLLRRGEQSQVYAALSQALAAFIADEIDRPPGSVSPLSVSDLLSNAGADEDTITQTREALESCDRARFSALSEPSEKVKDDYQRIARLIHKLDRRL